MWLALVLFPCNTPSFWSELVCGFASFFLPFLRGFHHSWESEHLFRKKSWMTLLERCSEPCDVMMSSIPRICQNRCHEKCDASFSDSPFAHIPYVVHARFFYDGFCGLWDSWRITVRRRRRRVGMLVSHLSELRAAHSRNLRQDDGVIRAFYYPVIAACVMVLRGMMAGVGSETFPTWLNHAAATGLEWFSYVYVGGKL